MSDLARLPEPHAPLTLRASSLPPGLSRDRLRGRHFERLSRDLYVFTGTADELVPRCAALLQVLPAEAVFCLHTAARLQELPVFTTDDTVHIAVPSTGGPVRRLAVRAHEWWLTSEHRTTAQGLPVVTAARNFLELSQHLRLEQLVAFGDAALHSGATDLAALNSTLTVATRRRGVVQAREALALLNPKAESPPESIVRVRMHLAGLPEAVAQDVIVDADGAFVARVDLHIRRYRVIIEYEGRHHRDEIQFEADLRRRNRLQSLGYVVIHLEASSLRSPQATLDPIIAALRAQGWRPS